jgi:hypothetical protein
MFLKCNGFTKKNIWIKVKSTSIPVTGRGGLYGCETLRIAHCLESLLTDGGEVISRKRRPRFTP